jgi:hypothetical protein
VRRSKKKTKGKAMSEQHSDNDILFCVECGQEMWLDNNEVSYHSGDGPDGIDHDADADHVAVSDENY